MKTSRDPVLAARFQPDVVHDPGLAAFHRRVHLKLAAGFVVSAAVAWAVLGVPAVEAFVFASPLAAMLVPTPWGLALVAAPVVVAAAALILVREASARIATPLYWLLAVALGAGLGVGCMAFGGLFAASSLLAGAGCFAGLALWGRVTGRNPDAVRAFLISVVSGLVVSGAVTAALPDVAAPLWLEAFGVLLLSGLVSADIERLRGVYFRFEDGRRPGRGSDYAALTVPLGALETIRALVTHRRAPG